MCVDEAAVPRPQEIAVLVENEDLGLALVASYDLARLGGHYAVVSPALPGELGVGNLRPVIDPLVCVCPAAYTHGRLLLGMSFSLETVSPVSAALTSSWRDRRGQVI